MFTYSTIWMGPISEEWYKKRRISSLEEVWSGGRIEVHDTKNPLGHANIEYSLPVMKGESWNLFSSWLEEHKTEELKSFEWLIHEFQDQANHRIVWASDYFTNIEGV